MKWGDQDNQFAFILFTIILLFGISQFFLINNYMDVPKLSQDRSYIFGVDNHNYMIHNDFSWSISFYDKKISNIENIIILLCMFWGLLRYIDLMRFLANYKKE